jgi:hypothetical protein
MHRHLRLAVWIKLPGVEFGRIETDVIQRLATAAEYCEEPAFSGEAKSCPQDHGGRRKSLG